MRRFALLVVAAITACGIAAAEQALAADAVEVGAVTRLRGDVTVLAAGKTKTLAVDTEIAIGDRLKTGPGARLEVKFFDGTLLTLGESADFTIDELVVTPGKGEALFTRTAGALRLLAGAVSKQADHKVEIASNAGTLGIRGTDVWGGTVKPGSQLDVFLIEGAVEVRTPAGTVLLDKPGLGTSVTAPGGAPSPPVQWPSDLRAQALSTVSFSAP
jgi:hypothetical protein